VVVEFEEEDSRLRHRVRRLRVALRLTKAPCVEAVLRKLTIDAESVFELIDSNR
jgi:hypothetical protein